MDSMDRKPCTSCGECCRRGGLCTLRRWGGLPDVFRGTCELLTDSECPAIADMLSETPVYPWPDDVKKKLLRTFIGVGCEAAEEGGDCE